MRSRALLGLLLLPLATGLAAAGANGTAEHRSHVYKPDPIVLDCAVCPRMVKIPGGSFLMGSPANEAGRYRNEGPQREIEVPALAIGESEVTREQWAAFAYATHRTTPEGCFTQGNAADDIWDWVVSASWRDPGFEQTPRHPVVCVSWADARDYTAWLTKKTGARYRLPSEAEWEYAARAGTASPYYWGTSGDRECAHMNGADRSLMRAVPSWEKAIQAALSKGESGSRLIECDDNSAFTSPVGTYGANAFGLRDMTGNVWELVEDCTADALPVDARPQTAPNCTDHRGRGGSWDDYPDDLRSAVRKHQPVDQRRNDVGFRVVRDLSPGDAH